MSSKNGTTAVAAIEKERAETLKAMSPATREVAKDFEHRLHLGQSGVVMINYDLGVRVNEVKDNEAKYGNGALEQLAKYLQLPSGASLLYKMGGFAKTFTRDFVKEQMAKPMAGGGSLSTGHWFALSQVESVGKQKELLKKVFTEGWTVNDLEAEIKAGVHTKHKRQGGRKPGVPTSPIAGLQKTSSMLLQFANWEKVAEKHVFDEIDSFDAERVNEQLVKKLDETVKLGETAKARIETMLERLTANRERVGRVLDEKYEAAEAGRQEMEGETKKKGAAAKKPAAKKVSKRPRAATATA